MYILWKNAIFCQKFGKKNILNYDIGSSLYLSVCVCFAACKSFFKFLQQTFWLRFVLLHFNFVSFLISQRCKGLKVCLHKQWFSCRFVSRDIMWHEATGNLKIGLVVILAWHLATSPATSGNLSLRVNQGCQIFLGICYQNQNKCSKWTQNVPNGYKISQRSEKYFKWP
jgi:hypothetical protein